MTMGLTEIKEARSQMSIAEFERAIDSRLISIETQVEGAIYLIKSFIPKSGYRNSAVELLNNSLIFVKKALEKVEVRPKGY